MKPFAVISALLVVALLYSFSPVFAEPSETVDTRQAREFWTKYGIPESVQDELAQKMQAGQFTDATLNTEPVSTHNWSGPGENSIISVYADGSISVSGSEKGVTVTPGSVRPAAAITACTVTRGSGWANFRNCTVFNQTDTVYIAIKANYSTYVGKPGEITSSWAHKFNTFGGTQVVDPLVRKRYQRTATSTSDAIALWGGSIKSWNGRYSETVSISLRVSATGVARAGTY